jgi:hypothetical protein
MRHNGMDNTKDITFVNISYFTAKSNIKLLLRILKKVLANIYSDERDIRNDTSHNYSFYSQRLFEVIRNRRCRVEAEVYFHLFLTWELVGGDWSR